jgi:hypothetical protein
MANTNLTVDQITNHALMILHQKLNFVGKINRQYDESHKTDGAKGGESIRIKLPNQFTVRTGAAISTQDVTQTSTTLTTGTQKGVDMTFTTKELTQDISLFSENYIEPAMSVLASNIESDAMSMYKDVYQEVSDVGAAMTIADALNMSKALNESLAPTAGRCLNLDNQANVDLVTDLKGLFNDPAKVSKNYREGMVANQFLGFQEVFCNSLWPTHTTGTDDGTGDYLINGASQTGATLTVDTGAGTWVVGDILTITGVNRVHPETKADTGQLMQFVVTATTGASATSIGISPSIVTSGATQNVSGSPADNAQVWKRESDNSTAIGASADYKVCLGFHKDAFAFATADLEVPQGVHFASRKVLDGISMRIVRQYDIATDKIPCRIDVLYGYKAIRPELAVRGGFN